MQEERLIGTCIGCGKHDELFRINDGLHQNKLGICWRCYGCNEVQEKRINNLTEAILHG